VKVTLMRHRRALVVLAQVVLSAAANYLAFLLRFDGTLPDVHVRPFLQGLPILLALRTAAFTVFRLHQGLWRYASVWDLQNIIGAVSLSSVAFALVVNVFVDLGPYPRSIHIIDSMLLIVMLGGVRMLRRVYHEFDRFQTERRVLIFGAGDAGEMIVRDMKNNRFYNCDPIGFVDDDIEKVGRSIHGVPVLGTREDLAKILEEEQPHEVIVAIPRAEPAQIRSIVRSLEPFKVPIKTLPNLSDVLAGRVELKQIRNLSLEDLMARRPIGLDHEPVRNLVNGRRVLVTGAGGSIGSELSRQLAVLGPSHLIVLDRYENTLFELCTSLGYATTCAFTPVIGDICDDHRMDRVFATMRPDIVFHAAAHKHVPLMETNPTEAVKNNVAGTRILSAAAMRHEVSEFVLISSDKAVNPSSVMGATKRVAELIVRSYASQSSTRFMAVRFGNVLGSNGSVAGIFERQIARGGPVTVTHPEMRRYFMLIPEAVSLVLHAAATQDTSTIFALDMGEQIRLVDFARTMIRLAGFVPEEEIAITYSGIRPGEKLSEELWEDGEISETSAVAEVFRVRSKPVPDNLHSVVSRLEAAAAAECDEEVLKLLSEIVPTFRTHAAAPRAAVAEQGVSSVGL
jgi:FlaA1/EpsC-like NDP-sugar epimerase